MIRASAPGRGGIIGNPSDMYGGTVVSCTIAERAEATVTSSPRLIFDVYGQWAEIKSEEELQFDDELHFLNVAKAVWQYLREPSHGFTDRLDPDATFHVRAQSAVPLKAGCAGSTAMLLAILAALLRHFEIYISRYELAELARRIERHQLGVHCGYQDQYMIVFGGLNCIDMRGKENHDDDPDTPYATVDPLTDDVPVLPFVLANTGIQRSSSEFHAEPRKKWEAGDPKRRAGFERIGELGRLGKKALLQGDWERLGELMNENHRLTDELVGAGEANNRLIKAALRAGALGAKLSGAGRGGTIIALHEDPDWMGERLLEAGAERLIYLKPVPGVTVERI
ncbi:MAG: hypothetical protein J7M38_06260 [Armatimonadetes bacterium]|nr:hypothetical protein [Armatimonadota bacterium]